MLYQAGADPYREDPYSPLDLDHDDLRERDRCVFAWARREGLPLAWVLAGGYTPDVIEGRGRAPRHLRRGAGRPWLASAAA